MHRKRAALEDAGLLTAHHLTAALLCQQDACLQSDVDYHPNFCHALLPPHVSGSRNLAFILLL